MKFTQILHKFHIGKATRYLWQHQRERTISVTKAEDILRSMNIPVQDATKAVYSNNQKSIIESNIFKKSSESNVVQLNWADRSCLTYEDHNLLQEGVPQACLLTKTLKVDDALPQGIENLATDIPNSLNSLITRFVYTSVIFDAEQVKLPRLKDPERPAWRFPRVYGISSKRKVYNLTKKFLQLCESLNGLDIAQYRLILHNGLSSVYIGKGSDVLKFSLTMDIFMASSVALTPIADINMQCKFNMPSLLPLHHTVGLPKLNICSSEDIYPINMESQFVNVHTIFIHYDPEEVKNITELPATESQIHARSMIKSFTVAAACARQRFGPNVKELPEPIVVQCVQSDGQNFHFSVYQLNTLDIDGTQGIKNFWWSKPSIKLYDEARYINGQPSVNGYNSDVFKNFLAFYKNK